MKQPAFFSGVVAAAVLGLIAAAFIAVFTPFIGIGIATRLLIPGLALGYLLYLFSRNAERSGRLTTVVLWSGMTVALWWIAPPLPFYLLLHAGAVWLIRSLYFYSGVFPSLIDMGLTGLSLVTAVWSLSRTGSVFLGTWCFFLVQALTAAIPRSMSTKRQAPPALPDDGFESARRRADAALQQLISQ